MLLQNLVSDLITEIIVNLVKGSMLNQTIFFRNLYPLMRINFMVIRKILVYKHSYTDHKKIFGIKKVVHMV